MSTKKLYDVLLLLVLTKMIGLTKSYTYLGVSDTQIQRVSFTPTILPQSSITATLMTQVCYPPNFGSGSTDDEVRQGTVGALGNGIHHLDGAAGAHLRSS